MLSTEIYPLTDYDALRELDADNASEAPSMSEEEINVLPVHKYKTSSQKGSSASRQRQDRIIFIYILPP